MARKTDARGRLEDDPFDYTVTKAGMMSITRGGRVVTTMGGAGAEQLLAKLEKTDDRGAQLLLAKATGNYKH